MGNILIHGMEMPKDYSVIVKIFPDGRVGTIPYVQWFKVELIEGTQAVPVPPHGKLVDVADVKELFEKHFGDDQIAFQLIDSVPVIIPPKSEEQQDHEDLAERLNREGIAP